MVFAGNFLVTVQAIILIPVIIKIAGVEVYGGYVLLSSIVALIYGISAFGVGYHRSRYLPSALDRVTRKKLFYPPLIFRFLSLIILSFVFIIFYPVLDNMIFKNEVIFSKWLILPYFVSYFILLDATDYFRYTHKINYFNFGNVSFPYLYIGIAILIYATLNNLSINSLFFSKMCAALLISLPLIVKVVREIGVSIKIPGIQDIKADIKLGFPLVLSYLIDVILSSSDRYLIAYFMSVSFVGYYNPAYLLGSFMIIMLVKVTSIVLPPLLSKSIDSGKENEAYKMVQYSLKGFFILSIPFIVGIAVLSKPILVLIANEEVAKNAYLVSPIVALGSLFYGMNMIFTNVLFVQKKTAAILKINIIATVVNLALNFILLAIFKNILVAAVTTFISYLISFIVIRCYVLSEWQIYLEWDIIIKSIGSSLLMGTVLFLISSQLISNVSNFIFVMIEVVIGIIIYSVTFLALRPFSAKEVFYAKKILHDLSFRYRNDADNKVRNSAV